MDLSFSEFLAVVTQPRLVASYKLSFGASLLAAAINAVSPNIPVLALKTMARQIDERTANERILTTIAGLLGALALILVGVGIYGIVAYTVARRTAELGIRMVLGATFLRVCWLVARGTIAVTLAGAVTGVVIARMGSGLLTNVLFGVVPSDPRVYAGAALMVLMTGVVAGAPPVLRAFRMNPVAALRYE